MRFVICFFAAVLTCPLIAVAADTELRFREVVIDPQIGRVCYGVTLADVDGDGKLDAVAISENRVVWYRNPDWTRHDMVVDRTQPENVCLAAHDIDGDGQIDFAIGSGWTGRNTGEFYWIRRGETLSDPWRVHPIGAEPWLHRMRWADVLGTGRPQLVISPLNATQGAGVRLTAFEVPDNPERDRWPSTVLSDQFNRMHNHLHLDLDEDGAIDTLTASREGLHLVRRDAGDFMATPLATGAAADDVNLRGAGEIQSGQLKDGTRFLFSVEPMHGTMLAVYLPPAPGETRWRRRVIDDTFRRGHALGAADLDGDGDDEIVMGHSDTPNNAFGVNVYDVQDATGETWKKIVVDVGGMATEDLVLGDVTGDGRPDILAGGRSTQNVKLYLNLAPGEQ